MRITARSILRRCIMASFMGLSLAGIGFAQEVGQPVPAQPPVLPETEVEGTNQPAFVEPFEPFTGDDGGAASPLVGPFFAAPVVGYRAPTSTAGTIADIPLLSFPGTIDVVPRDLINDQEAIRFDDILRNVAGAAPFNDPVRGDRFLLRGMELRATNFRKNGFLDPTSTPRDFANVERVDFLKGPASVIYGANQPSGVVNVVTKKPLDTQFAYGTAQFGSWDFQRYQADVNGYGNEDGTVLYRFNGAYQNNNSFRDFGFDERTFVSPVVTWVVDERTTLTFEAEYYNNRRNFDTGLVAFNNNPFSLPNSRFLGEPTDFAQNHDYRASVFLTHELGECWNLMIGGSTLFYDMETSGTVPVSALPGPFPPANTLVRVRQDVVQNKESNHAVIANLVGEVSGPMFDHQIVIGTEQDWFVADGFVGTFSDPNTAPLLIDPYNPVYNNPAFMGFIPTGLPNPAVAGTFNTSYRQNRHGFYLQDLVSVNDHLDVLGGVRFDIARVEFDRNFAPLIPPTETDTTYYRTSPRVGFVFYPFEERALSLYGVYSQSFDPPAGGARLTTNALEPETGETWEGGVKAEVWDNFTLVANGFYIDKENVTVDQQVVDPNTGIPIPPYFATTQVGRQRSQGFELSAIGQITDPWSVVLNYAYVDTLSQDSANPQFNNTRVRGVPLNSGSLWTRYNLIQDEVHTFGLALGSVYMSDRLGDYLSPLELPGYVRWDTGAFYQRGRFDASLYVENFFDRNYISNSTSAYQVYSGAPVNFRAMAGIVF